MTSGSVERALKSALKWLMAQDAPEAAIAAHELGVASDSTMAERWVRRILDEQDASGAWGGALITTAGALLTLEELRAAASLREQDPGIGRALDWLRARRGVAGAWSDGCSKARHRNGICHHFLGGFFSPGPPEAPHEEARLRSGVRARGDAQSRFVASAAALRCVLQWTHPTPDTRLHLKGLGRVVSLWPDQIPDELSTASLLAAIHALLGSSAAEDRGAAERGLRVLAGKQRGDGSWVETDPFQALEVFACAESVGVDRERSHRALWHGARLLTASQRDDGSWGGDAAPRRALIACRTLRLVDPAASV